MKKQIAVVLAVFSGLFASAQQPWGLKQCIDYGLANHKTNEIYKGNIEKANQLRRENVALYFPQVTADLRFDDYLDLQTFVIPAGTFFPDLGGGDREIQFGKKFTTVGTIEAEQMLYNRLLLVSFRGLRPNKEVANLSFQQNRETLIYSISQAYLQAQILKQQITLLGENEKKFVKQLEITKLQVEKGVAKKLDANRISVA